MFIKKIIKESLLTLWPWYESFGDVSIPSMIIFRCDLSNPEETKELLTAEQYEEFLKECEEH